MENKDMAKNNTRNLSAIEMIYIVQEVRHSYLQLR